MSLAAEYDKWHTKVFESDPEHADESSPWYQIVLKFLPSVKGQADPGNCMRPGRLLAASGFEGCFGVRRGFFGLGCGHREGKAASRPPHSRTVSLTCKSTHRTCPLTKIHSTSLSPAKRSSTFQTHARPFAKCTASASREECSTSRHRII